MFKRRLAHPLIEVSHTASAAPPNGSVSADDIKTVDMATSADRWNRSSLQEESIPATPRASGSKEVGSAGSKSHEGARTESISQSFTSSGNPRHSVQSSVYSQESPEMRSQPLKLDISRASSIYPDDVSPPDSPRTNDGGPSGRSTSPNISPITDGGHSLRSALTKPHMSSIPLPKSSTAGTAAYISGWREKIAKEKAAVNNDSANAEAKPLRWDSYSGEPSARGKPQTTIPAQYAEEFEKKDRSPTTNVSKSRLGDEVKNTSVRQQRQNLWATKLKKAGKKDGNVVPEPQEEWKGSSGRAPIVQPPVDKPLPPDEKPFTPQPQKDRSNVTTGLRQVISATPRRESSSPVQTAFLPHRRSFSALPRKDSLAAPGLGVTGIRSAEAATPPLGESLSTASPPAMSTSVIARHERTPSPDRRSPLSRMPPERIRKPVGLEPVHIITEPAEFDASPNMTRSPMAYDSPRPDSTNQKPSPSSEYDSYSPDSEHQLRSAVSAMQLDLGNEPPSRFSVTTYNTAIPDSPPETPHLSEEDRPPLPSGTSSILHRKRPIPTAGVAMSKPPTRKPTPSDIETSFSRKQSLAGKPMPPSPSGGGDPPVDRVTQLQAKLTALNRRQGNLQTVIHELTHVVQPSSIAYDMASRSEIKKTVEGLKTESAAVAKEVYETGMKLHRALKRRDEESMFEPTGLWVRRVTE